MTNQCICKSCKYYEYPNGCPDAYDQDTNTCQYYSEITNE